MMQISEYNVPALCAGGNRNCVGDLAPALRCIACNGSLGKLIIEFENEFLAGRLTHAVEAGTPEILFDENFLLEALGEEAKLEYKLVKLTEDEEWLQNLLKTLWRDDGIAPKRMRPRDMSGIKRILIVQYGFVHGIRFRNEPDRFAAWLKKLGLLNLPGEITPRNSYL